MFTWQYIVQAAVYGIPLYPTEHLCGYMSILNNMAWWYFTITHFLASYKVCMLFYYSLHNLYHILTVFETQTFYLPFLCCVILLLVFSFIAATLDIQVYLCMFQTNTRYIMWEFLQNYFKFLIDKNVIRNECIRIKMRL